MESQNSAPECSLHATLDSTPGAACGQSLHPFFRLPKDPETDFVGRDNILEEMVNVFREKRHILLYGPTNFGKKEIALQFASRRRRQFDCILYINCAEQYVLEADVQATCQSLHLKDLKELVQHLKHFSSLLVILTDCQEDMLRMVKTFIRPLIEHPHGKVIFTSSLAEPMWENTDLNYKLIEVTNFGLDDTKDFVKKHLKPSQYRGDDFQTLQRLVDGSPSILRRVVLHIARKKKTIKEFLSTRGMQNGDVFDPSEMDRKLFASIHKRPMLCSLFHMLSLVSSHTPLKLDILKIGLPEAMKSNLRMICPHAHTLAELARHLKDSQDEITARSDLKDILELPITHQLLIVTGGELEQVKVRGVIQQKYLLFTDGECCCGAFIQRVACLCLLGAMHLDRKHSQQLVPHLKAVLGRSTGKDASIFTYSSPIPFYAKALLARHYIEDSHFTNAAKLLSEPGAGTNILSYSYQWLMHRWTALLSFFHNIPKETRSIACLVWLGRAYLWLGNCQKSIKVLEEAEESSRNPNSLETAVILTHLASARTEAGQLKEAKEYFDRAILIFEKNVDSSGFDGYNLGLYAGEEPEAYLLSRMGKYERWQMYSILARMKTTVKDECRGELEQLIKKSLANFEDACKRYRDSNVQNRCQELIMDLYIECQKMHLIKECKHADEDTGRMSRCEDIVKGLEQQLTPGNHNIGWAKMKIGWIRSQTSPGSREELQKALQEFEEGEAIASNVYSDNHRKIANAYRLKASILENMGQTIDAIDCLERAKCFLMEKDDSSSNEPKLLLVQKTLAQLKRSKKKLSLSDSDRL